MACTVPTSHSKPSFLLGSLLSLSTSHFLYSRNNCLCIDSVPDASKHSLSLSHFKKEEMLSQTHMHPYFSSLHNLIPHPSHCDLGFNPITYLRIFTKIPNASLCQTQWLFPGIYALDQVAAFGPGHCSP